MGLTKLIISMAVFCTTLAGIVQGQTNGINNSVGSKNNISGSSPGDNSLNDVTGDAWFHDLVSETITPFQNSEVNNQIIPDLRRNPLDSSFPLTDVVEVNTTSSTKPNKVINSPVEKSPKDKVHQKEISSSNSIFDIRPQDLRGVSSDRFGLMINSHNSSESFERKNTENTHLQKHPVSSIDHLFFNEASNGHISNSQIVGEKSATNSQRISNTVIEKSPPAGKTDRRSHRGKNKEKQTKVTTNQKGQTGVENSFLENANINELGQSYPLISFLNNYIDTSSRNQGPSETTIKPFSLASHTENKATQLENWRGNQRRYVRHQNNGGQIFDSIAFTRNSKVMPDVYSENLNREQVGFNTGKSNPAQQRYDRRNSNNEHGQYITEKLNNVQGQYDGRNSNNIQGQRNLRNSNPLPKPFNAIYTNIRNALTFMGNDQVANHHGLSSNYIKPIMTSQSNPKTLPSLLGHFLFTKRRHEHEDGGRRNSMKRRLQSRFRRPHFVFDD